MGFALYQYYDQNRTGAVLFGVCIVLGLITGIMWAIQVSGKYGAHHFISRTEASEDISEAVREKPVEKTGESGTDRM